MGRVGNESPEVKGTFVHSSVVLVVCLQPVPSLTNYNGTSGDCSEQWHFPGTPISLRSRWTRVVLPV